MNAAERSRRYRETHRDEIGERRRAARQAHPERVQEEQERSARWRQANPGAMAAHGRKWNQANRQAVFDHYGWACACCGSTENPTIDHVNGDGREHREEIGRGGSVFHRWLIDNGFPDGFQTLCRTCNCSKKAGERCQIDHTAATAALRNYAPACSPRPTGTTPNPTFPRSPVRHKPPAGGLAC